MTRIRVLIRTLALLTLLLTATAQAGFFIGTPISTELKGEDSIGYLGVQLGSYDLGSGFGLRAGLEILPPLGSGAPYQATGDLLYGIGETTVFYLGAGGGYAALGSSESFLLSGTLGLDIDAASLISVFAEAQPRYNLRAESVALYLRTGLNFHFGD
jgi:hypothetical protein